MTATAVAPIVVLIDGEKLIVAGRFHALIGSKSHPGQWHALEWSEEEGWSCSCESFTYRKRCRHLVAVRRWLAGRATVEFPEDRDA